MEKLLPPRRQIAKRKTTHEGTRRNTKAEERKGWKMEDGGWRIATKRSFHPLLLPLGAPSCPFVGSFSLGVLASWRRFVFRRAAAFDVRTDVRYNAPSRSPGQPWLIKPSISVTVSSNMS